MTDAPFSDDVPRPGARSTAARRPWQRAVRCPAACRRPPGARPVAGQERFEGFVALHSAISAGPEFSSARLWAGGVVATLVGMAMVVVGWVIARVVLGLSVPAPVEPAAQSPLTCAVYALCAAAVAIEATALLHLFIEVSRRPVHTFAWSFGLLVLAAAAVPFMLGAPLDAAAATAAINLGAGLAVLAVLAAAAVLAAEWPGPCAGPPVIR